MFYRYAIQSPNAGVILYLSFSLHAFHGSSLEQPPCVCTYFLLITWNGFTRGVPWDVFYFNGIVCLTLLFCEEAVVCSLFYYAYFALQLVLVMKKYKEGGSGGSG